MKKFYHSVIEIESLFVEFDSLDLSTDQKKHLAILTDSMLHNTIIDAILSELPESDKKEFLEKLMEDDDNKIWDFLNFRVNGVEDKIKKVANDLKSELHEDLKEAKNKQSFSANKK